MSARTLPSPLRRPYTRPVTNGDESLLDVIDEGTRDDLVRRMRRRRFARGEVIYRDGDPGDAIHLVDEGHALVRISTPLGDEVILDVVGRGELLAISGLLTPERRHVGTATALGPVQTRSLPWRDVEQLRETEPRVERFLTGMLARQQQRLIGYVLEALYVPADVRVLRRLAELSAKVGTVEGARTVVTISQEDLGAMAGTTRRRRTGHSRRRRPRASCRSVADASPWSTRARWPAGPVDREGGEARLRGDSARPRHRHAHTGFPGFAAHHMTRTPAMGQGPPPVTLSSSRPRRR